MSKFKELILAKNAVGDAVVFLAPTSKASEGDTIFFDGDLFEVTETDWINLESKTYRILQEAGLFLTPDKILSVRWEKEEQKEIDDEQDT